MNRVGRAVIRLRAATSVVLVLCALSVALTVASPALAMAADVQSTGMNSAPLCQQAVKVSSPDSVSPVIASPYPPATIRVPSPSARVLFIQPQDAALGSPPGSYAPLRL